MTTTTEFIAKMNIQLNKLNEHLEKLSGSSLNQGRELDAVFTREVAELRLHSKLTSTKLGQLAFARDDSWNTAVADIAELNEAFMRSCDYFSSQFQRATREL